MHGRYLTPTVSTIAMGAISIVLYIPLNYISGGNVIADAVTAIGLYIAFYYGLTGFTCVWYYRTTLTSSTRNLWMRGILPLLGGLIMYFAGGWSLWSDYDVATGNSFTSWTMPFYPHWRIGGDVRDRVPVGPRRAHRCTSTAGSPSGLLQEGDPHPRHPDPGPRDPRRLPRFQLTTPSVPAQRTGPKARVSGRCCRRGPCGTVARRSLPAQRPGPEAG